MNLRDWRVVYRGVDIPTRPPRNLQRQPMLALAVLAEHAGQLVPVADLAEGMRRLGRLDRRLVAPDPRDLRYKVLAPFRHALKRTVERAEVDRLVESVAGNSLRLNAPGPVSVVARSQGGSMTIRSVPVANDNVRDETGRGAPAGALTQPTPVWKRHLPLRFAVRMPSWSRTRRAPRGRRTVTPEQS